MLRYCNREVLVIELADYRRDSLTVYEEGYNKFLIPCSLEEYERENGRYSSVKLV